MINNRRENKVIIILIAIILVFAVFTCHILFKSSNKSGILLESEGREKVLNQSISIFGFSELHMKSGELNQSFDFRNPSTNDCYMDISLLLSDGTKLFEIKRIEPGYGIKEVQLNDVLENGDYLNCCFNVQCFSLKDDTQLNGASMSVDLYVR